MKTFEEVMTELGAKSKEDLTLEGTLAINVKELLKQLDENPVAKQQLERLVSWAMVLTLVGEDPIKILRTIIRCSIVQGYEIAKRMYSPELPK